MDSNPDSGTPRGPGGRLPVERYLSAIIAHELGNPFTAFIGRLEMLEMRKGLPDSARRDLEATRQAGDRMTRILESIKNFSRGTMGRPGDVTLQTVMERAAARGRALFPDITLEGSLPGPDIKVKADAQLLEEALVTTLETLASRRGGISTMTMSWDQDKEIEEISVTLVDDGPSMSEGSIAKLFHPFSGNEPPGSKGLISLSYAYYVIRAWGGTYRFPRAEMATAELCLVAA